jgi:hypothetical protein
MFLLTPTGAVPFDAMSISFGEAVEKGSFASLRAFASQLNLFEPPQKMGLFNDSSCTCFL